MFTRVAGTIRPVKLDGDTSAPAIIPVPKSNVRITQNGSIRTINTGDTRRTDALP